jgi:hypothetical protein
MNIRSRSHDHAETIGDAHRYYFPPPGQWLNKQSQQVPEAVGLDSAIIRRISRFVLANQDDSKTPTPRWALWRHGHLVHIDGDLNQTMDVCSHRNPWHTMNR